MDGHRGLDRGDDEYTSVGDIISYETKNTHFLGIVCKVSEKSLRVMLATSVVSKNNYVMPGECINVKKDKWRYNVAGETSMKEHYRSDYAGINDEIKKIQNAAAAVKSGDIKTAREILEK